MSHMHLISLVVKIKQEKEAEKKGQIGIYLNHHNNLGSYAGAKLKVD
jgi:hypothetical protein